MNMKNSSVMEKFTNAGLFVKKLITIEDLRSNNWIMATGDKEGMIKLETKKSS